VHHPDRRLAQVQHVAVGDQPAEGGAVGDHVHGLEQGGEVRLDLADMGADDHGGAGRAADMVGGRQVVGVRVGLQHVLEGQAQVLRGGQDGVSGAGGHLGRGRRVVEHRVNDGGDLGRVVPDQIGHRECRGVEEGLLVNGHVYLLQGRLNMHYC
jgi:hypothetical protein